MISHLAALGAVAAFCVIVTLFIAFPIQFLSVVLCALVMASSGVIYVNVKEGVENAIANRKRGDK